MANVYELLLSAASRKINNVSKVERALLIGDPFGRASLCLHKSGYNVTISECIPLHRLISKASIPTNRHSEDEEQNLAEVLRELNQCCDFNKSWIVQTFGKDNPLSKQNAIHVASAIRALSYRRRDYLNDYLIGAILNAAMTAAVTKCADLVDISLPRKTLRDRHCNNFYTTHRTIQALLHRKYELLICDLAEGETDLSLHSFLSSIYNGRLVTLEKDKKNYSRIDLCLKYGKCEYLLVCCSNDELRDIQIRLKVIEYTKKCYILTKKDRHVLILRTDPGVLTPTPEQYQKLKRDMRGIKPKKKKVKLVERNSNQLAIESPLHSLLSPDPRKKNPSRSPAGQELPTPR